MIKGTSEYIEVFAPLGENERKDYTADFTLELTDCDGNLVDSLISPVTWTHEPEDKPLTFDGEGFLENNTQAVVFISTPEAGTFYRIVCTVQTAGGRTYEKAFGLPAQKIDGTK